MKSKTKKIQRAVSFILFICMFIGILSQTTLSLDMLTDTTKGKGDFLVSDDLMLAGEYSALEGRAKQELIIKYKDNSKALNIGELTRDPNITSLDSKEKIDNTLELLEIDSKDDIGKVIERLNQDPNVEYVQPNYEITIMSINEPYIGLQWGIQNTGQNINNNIGTERADMNLLPMLDVAAENEMIVAVLDTGIDNTHEDLVGKIDTNGWNFVGNNNNTADIDGHGTQMAGVIGAAQNHIGIFGVAQNVKLLPLKVIENGIGYTSDVIEAIQYAENMGAKIANCSFGSAYFNYALFEAMNESDMLFVCAAGNTGTISNIYPASYDMSNVLSVTSINNKGELASNASYGQTVDIAAPGVDIYSTAKNNAYAYGSGSSYAAAFAAGAAARLLGTRNMTAAEIKAVLQQSSSKTESLRDRVKTGGMLNAAGSYDLIKDGQEITINYDNGGYDEKILQMLEDDDYANLTEEEKTYLCESMNISRELLEECISAGHALGVSVNYAAKIGRFGFTLQEIMTLNEVYSEYREFDHELNMLNELVSNVGVAIEDLAELKQLMLSGYKASNVVYTFIVSKALNVPIQILVKKDQDISKEGYKNITGTNFTNDEKQDIWRFSLTYWLDTTALINYMTENNITFDELVNKIGIQHNKINMIFPLAGDIITDSTPKNYPIAPFLYTTNSEKINLNTGSLIYENIDAVLPGKNGMDLVIMTKYDSSQANIDDTFLRTQFSAMDVIWQHAYDYYTGQYYGSWMIHNNGSPVNLPSTGYFYNGQFCQFFYQYQYGYILPNPSYSTLLRQSNHNLQNNLGIGWSFGFSRIEIADSYKYLHLGDGTVYTIASSFSSDSSNLEKYPLLDMQIITDNGTFTNGQVSSYYILKYKNGVNEYFSSDGRLLGKKDRFGNTIKFTHTAYNGKYLITQITDTLNRVVTISYPNTTVGGNVVITLPDNSQITYVLEKMSGYYGTTCKLTQRKDQLNRITTFTYSIDSIAEKLTNQTNATNKRYLDLTKVTHPTGVASEYSYVLKDENIGTNGKTQMYKILQRLDRQASTTYNVETYLYSGSYTAYPTYNNMDLASSSYTYTTTVTNDVTGGKTATTFNNQHLQTNITMTNSSNTKLRESVYEYNSDKQLTKSEERTYASNGLTYQKSINNYQYDTGKKNNIIGHWNPLAGGSTASTEYKTTYSYNATYNYITSKQYKQSSNKTITEEYTPSSDNKTITWKKIYEQIGTSAKILKDATKYSYDSFGNITEEQRYYDNLTNLTTYIATKMGYTYNTGGTSVFSVSTENVKDADNQLVATTGNGAGVLKNTHEYDKMGRITKSTDGKNNSTLYQYDLLGRQTKITNPDNTFKTFTYETTSAINALTETNEKGTVMKYFYDGLGNIRSIRDMSIGTDLVTFEYDRAFRLTRESTLSAHSTNGSRTDYTYDVLSRVLTKTVSNSNSITLSKETYVYDDANQSGLYRLVTHTVEGDVNSPSVKTTAYADNAGRIAKQGYFIGTTEYTDDYTYDYAGNKLTVKTAQTKNAWNTYGYTNKWEYDYANRVTREYDIYGKYSLTEYNELGQKVRFKDPKANETAGSKFAEYEYDALGRLIIERTPFDGTAVSTVKYYYDNNSNITQQQTSSNAIGAAAQFTKVDYVYNNRDMLTRVTNYNGSTAASHVQYFYDAIGNIFRMYTGHSAVLTINGLDSVSGTIDKVTKYEYDRFSNLTKLTDPMGYIETNTYDLLGNVLTKTDRNGKLFTYSYDGLGRLLSTTSGGVTLESYTYTLTGNQRTESNGTSTTTNTYDSLGRLTKAEDKNNATNVATTKDYTYDVGSNRLTSIVKVGTTTTNNTKYTYDEASRMKTVSENSALQCTYNYDVNGNRSSLVYTNGVTTDYTYNLANMVKTLTNKKGTAILSSYSYVYQLDGNQTQKTDHTGKVTNYVYDGLGRLTSETEKMGTTVVFSLSYQYDASSNRTRMTDNSGVVTNYVYDKNNRLTSTTETAGQTTTKSNYSYDKNGNTLAKMTETTSPSTGQAVTVSLSAPGSSVEIYEYDLLNRMVMSTVGGVVTTYKYRADGLRLSKTSGGAETVHIWDGANIVGDVVGGTVRETYVRGIGLIASKNGITFMYYLYNGHGDVVQTANASGVVHRTYDYDAFGNERALTITQGLPESAHPYTHNFNNTWTWTYQGATSLDVTFSSDTETEKNYDWVYIYDKQGNQIGSKYSGTELANKTITVPGDTVQIKFQTDGSVVKYGFRVTSIAVNTTADANPFRYAGEYFDSNNGTYYLRNRYYSPKLGRFMTEDPVGAGLNWYTYANCNPVMFIDPSGLVDVSIWDYVQSYGEDVNGRWADVYFERDRWVIYWGGYSLWITPGENGTWIDGRMFADDSLFINAFGTGRERLVVYQDPYLTENISIRANFNITGAIYNDAIDHTTYAAAFLQAIKDYWSGSFGDYNVSTYVGLRKDGINVNINEGFGIPTGGAPFWNSWWSPTNVGRINMYKGHSDRKPYHLALEDFMALSAHEFGHILGLKDNYDYSKTIMTKLGRNGLQVYENDISLILKAQNAKKAQKP